MRVLCVCVCVRPQAALPLAQRERVPVYAWVTQHQISPRMPVVSCFLTTGIITCVAKQFSLAAGPDWMEMDGIVCFVWRPDLHPNS